MTWINVAESLPIESFDEPAHLKRLWICTARFGAQEGFFMEGKFMSDYSCQILEVTHWLELPELPEKL